MESETLNDFAPILIKSRVDQLLWDKYNHWHRPAGKPDGGQFDFAVHHGGSGSKPKPQAAPAGGGGGTSGGGSGGESKPTPAAETVKPPRAPKPAETPKPKPPEVVKPKPAEKPKTLQDTYDANKQQFQAQAANAKNETWAVGGNSAAKLHALNASDHALSGDHQAAAQSHTSAASALRNQAALQLDKTKADAMNALAKRHDDLAFWQNNLHTAKTQIEAARPKPAPAKSPKEQLHEVSKNLKDETKRIGGLAAVNANAASTYAEMGKHDQAANQHNNAASNLQKKLADVKTGDEYKKISGLIDEHMAAAKLHQDLHNEGKTHAATGSNTTPAGTIKPAADAGKITSKHPEYEQKQKEWEASITPKEMKALHMYTGSGYKNMRKCQNLGKGCNDWTKEKIQDLQNVLARAPKVEGTVHRGMAFESDAKAAAFVAKAMKSGKLPDKGFLSTSEAFHVAQGFMGYGSSSVHLKINVKSGVHIGNVSTHKHEKETLMPAGKKYKVLSVSRDSGGRHVIELEEV